MNRKIWHSPTTDTNYLVFTGEQQKKKTQQSFDCEKKTSIHYNEPQKNASVGAPLNEYLCAAAGLLSKEERRGGKQGKETVFLQGNFRMKCLYEIKHLPKMCNPFGCRGYPAVAYRTPLQSAGPHCRCHVARRLWGTNSGDQKRVAL